jgi:hypothetical protein
MHLSTRLNCLHNLPGVPKSSRRCFKLVFILFFASFSHSFGAQTSLYWVKSNPSKFEIHLQKVFLTIWLFVKFSERTIRCFFFFKGWMRASSTGWTDFGWQIHESYYRLSVHLSRTKYRPWRVIYPLKVNLFVRELIHPSKRMNWWIRMVNYHLTSETALTKTFSPLRLTVFKPYSFTNVLTLWTLKKSSRC